MEQLPELGQTTSFELTIPVLPCFFDHAVNGKPVLPAVEAMELLSRFVNDAFPSFHCTSLQTSSFGKFLQLTRQDESINALVEIERVDEAAIKASLQTKIQFKSGISRRLNHASVHFTNETPRPMNEVVEAPEILPVDEMEACDIYRDIIPFGKHYQNLKGSLKLTRQGVSATVFGGSSLNEGRILGSPFTLDAAFHSACVWGAHFHKKVIYPVKFGQRYIGQPTEYRSLYRSDVVFTRIESQSFFFNLMIRDQNEKLREVVLDLEMKEIAP